MGGKTPQAAAEEFVRTSKLKDVAERKRLAADHNLVLKSDDGMIRLARLLEDPARKLLKRTKRPSKRWKPPAASGLRSTASKCSAVNDYPDATLTPRVTFGSVKAYRDKTKRPSPSPRRSAACTTSRTF